MEEFKYVVFKKYAEFNGRARRREFWMFLLFSFIISIALSIIDSILGTEVGRGNGILSSLYSLAIIVPSIAVTVRRLHDTNRSGWWWFLWLIPIVGWIILIVWLATDSMAGDNQYGPNSKGTPMAPTSSTPSVA
ncbi:DUF805 domain-containing protein [Candidatus Nomurabacteria bacterium]|nr:DUF805 domain-containing protein [Candidatus Nomurabacteria bacterium]